MLEDMPSRTYWMIVEGDLSERLTFAFGGMPSTRSEGTTAALTTRIRDQAELQGRTVRGRPWAHPEATAIDIQTECGSVAPRPPDPQRTTD